MTEALPPQKVGDVRGWLCFDELLPSDLQNAEDACQGADFARQSSVHWLRGYDPDLDARVLYFTRPATPTERILLAHLGYDLPADLITWVHYVTQTLRRRRWPQLEGSTP